MFEIKSKNYKFDRILYLFQHINLTWKNIIHPFNVAN